MIPLILLTALFALLYYKASKSLHYWKDRGVAHLRPLPVFGNLASVAFKRISVFDQMRNWYNHFRNERYFGVHDLIIPVLILRDLELIKRITVKDFEYFTDHNNLVTEDIEPLMEKSLLILKGQRWRNMRATLSPSFTGNKMKLMFALMSECAEEFTRHFQNLNQNLVVVEMKDICTRFTNDVIATTAFGVKCNSLDDKKNQFYAMGYKRHPYKTRKGRAGTTDMINLLMEARKQKIDYPKQNLIINDEDITAQAITFFFAGFETSSTAMTFIAYELALNEDVQKRLQEEIDDTLFHCQGKLTYDALNDMKYMDMVVSEAIRKWPPAFFIDRLCVKDYFVKPVSSKETGLLIEKGTMIQIPIIGIHRDPKYHPNPDAFDPERFNEDNKHKIEPFTYIPFGSGPRRCIATRFALMESKILMFHLLSKFDIVRIKKTLHPMETSKLPFNIAPAKGVWLGLRLRNNEQHCKI
ncbi:hypothetical protein FQR65_LT17686 [Abscondita terminalis]|nr:hypothetical protein FQR65_LT17686 [Abscondita terminalis]